jgi:hypothetical protein
MADNVLRSKRRTGRREAQSRETGQQSENPPTINFIKSFL